MAEKLTINVISDIHYYPESSGASGTSYMRALGKSQKLLAESEQVLADCFDRLAADSEADIVLVSGDTTNNGEKAAHYGAIDLLRSLKARGKRVYVLTATHDYKQDGRAAACDGENNVTVPAFKREELFDLYSEFGPNEAIAVHRESMSYIVQLADGYRLFALNDDTNLNGASGFSDECFAWIKEQATAAKRNGQFIVAMTHHPLIPPSPFYYAISPGDMMGGFKQRREQLSELGIDFVLTGHTHMQDISRIFTENGKSFYDITTASPIGFPGTYRKLTCDSGNNTVDVTTVEFAKESKLKLDGMPLYAALEKQLCGMIKDVITAAATDSGKFASMATAFSIKESKGKKLGLLLKPVAKYIDGLTIGKVASKVRKSCGLAPADYAGIADERVVDFIVSLVLHLFEGDSPYTPDTPHYAITVAVLDKLDRLLAILHIDLGKLLHGTKTLKELVLPLLYNDGICDKQALLDLSEAQMKAR